jgi:GTP pyrophosphokinase
LLRTSKTICNAVEFRDVKESFRMAMEACEKGPLKFGDLAILHALEITRIVVDEIGLGSNSTIASLLFDFIADGTIDMEMISQRFNPQVIKIISGLTKIAGVDTQKSDNQGDHIRNLLINLSEDVRVILIKIADRLYYMRHLADRDRAEQLKVANETLYIYAPLAHRLGLYTIKSELEDLALKFLDSKAYYLVMNKLQETKTSRDRLIREFIRPIREELHKQGFLFDIKGRTKSVYSIWTKMKNQNVDFEEVYDLFAIRIILDCPQDSEKNDCWRVYSVVTDFYQPNPDRLRDWISVPKSNGYESLHTTVVVPGGKWVEVQIRSARMNEVAEKGIAAHWKYKSLKTELPSDDWMGRLREILENPEQDSEDIIDDFKLSLYNKEIFVFTPKGDLKKFPRGATVLDFAFDIHTDVGSTCMGAKINGQNVPIRHLLNNGDKVEIITSKNQKPKQDWINYVVTSKAKSKIKIALKEEKLAEAENGKEILRRRFKNWKIAFEDQNISKLLRHYKLKTSPDLYYLIATDKIDILKIKDIILEKEKTVTSEKESVNPAAEKLITPSARHDDFLIIDDSIDRLTYRLARCCNPIYGDEVFGFVTVGSGITIHRVNCPNAGQLISRYGYRVLKARWSDRDSKIYLPATIRITGIDDLGIVGRISDVISKDLRVNIRTIAMDSNEGIFEGTITLFVRDTGHLDLLIRSLSKVKGILSVRRLEL